MTGERLVCFFLFVPKFEGKCFCNYILSWIEGELGENNSCKGPNMQLRIFLFKASIMAISVMHFSFLIFVASAGKRGKPFSFARHPYFRFLCSLNPFLKWGCKYELSNYRQLWVLQWVEIWVDVQEWEHFGWGRVGKWYVGMEEEQKETLGQEKCHQCRWSQGSLLLFAISDEFAIALQ